MARGCSWCMLAALIVLLFVTTEGLRDRATQTDDQKIANRGNLRFNSKSVEEATSTTTVRSRSFRDRTTQPTLSKYDDGTTLTSITEPESKFDSIKRSFAPITTTDATNYLRRTPSGRNGETKKTEPTVNRRNGRRYSTDNNEETKSRDNNQKVESSNRLSRKTSNGREGGTNVTEKLENGGPSVFQATTESSRSRTGRKIQTTYSVKDIKTQVPASRRFGNRKNAEETATVSIRREGRGRSTTEKVERSTRASRSKANLRENNSVNRRSQDVPLIESESIRVDIPLSVDETDSPVSDVTTPFGIVSQRRSDTKEPTRNNNRTGSERSKNRSRLNDFDTAGSSKSNSRRGSSKFNDQTSTEANEQVISPRRNVVARDRKRGPESKKNSPNESRLRSNARNLENSVKSSADGPERDVKRKSSANRRSRVVDGTPKAVANRGQDSQDSRSKLRNRSRSDATTTITPDVTTTVAQETTAFGDVTTVNSEFTSTTLRSTTLSPPSSRTTTRSPVAAITPSSTTISTSEAPGRSRGRNRGGGQRKKQKEDFFNHGLGFRGRKPTPETPLANTVDPQRNTLRNDSQPFGSPGWTLRRRPSHTYNSESPTRAVLSPPRDQTNEVIPSNEISTSTETVTTEENLISSTNRGYKKLQTTEETATVEVTTKGYRRGGKSFGFGKVTVEPSENDNYPPEFKARLKSTNTKIPALVTTPRSPSEVKKSSAALFAERSRMKLELARRLVKPELNIEENDLDATTASSFNEPISTVISITDETSKILKYSKSSSPSMGRRVYTSVESSPEQVNAKDSKVSNSRKGQGNISKVRSSGSKKGRIIAERMVTSISVEERAVPEETTKPYSLPTNPPTIVSTSAEEGTATSVDTTKVRLSVNRGGNKSKEEEFTTVKKDVKVSMAVPRRVSDNDSTLTSRKPYVYQSRGKGLQQSGSVEQESTESLMKKSHVSSQTKFNAGQRRFQGSQEDDASEKPRFSTSTSRSTLRPRYSKRIKQKSSNEKVNSSENTVPTKSRVAVGRYSRKKSVVKSLDEKNKSITEDPEKQTKRHEFRPRTATYRRHSEVPLTLVQSSPRIEGVGVAITPKTPRYHATLKTSTVSPRSVSQEAQVNLRIANESTSDSPGVIGSSDGDSGNANIFNPARSAILSANGTLIEQLRSTVAPLLSSLGNKTPVFSGSYSNVNNANSPPRITPSGQPPRFSARYKGAELFVRKQNNVYQPTVPSITSSSTTPSTPVEDTTSTTAQGTAGSGIGQTTEPSSSMIPETSTTVSPRSSTSTGSDSPLTTTTSPSVVTMTTTTTTETTPTAIGRVPDTGTTTISSRMDVATVTPMTEAPTTISDVATEENRTSTEAGATMASPENITTTTMDTRQEITNETATTSTPSMTMPTSTTPTTISSTQAPTSPQLGRFGGNRLTPAPRFSVSSSTRAPLRDYLVYGIYPNKTIVRKRPEDNLIDARNVDSPYVIFGIFPDGRLVRKFPNGTIIPDPPRNPVENDALRNTQTGPVPSIVSTGRPPTDSQGGRIVQDRERDEATRTKEAGGQRSSVYIGQEKFVNYWTDQASTASPRVHSVNINTVASAASVGRSPAIPSFENLLDNQPSGQVTAPPGFPWRDPLDQIFGITTPSPVITASVASNTLDDTSDGNVQGLVRPMNPFVEVFTPFSSAIGVPRGNVGTVPPPPMTTAGTSSSATTTTTTAPTTTTITPTTTTTTTSTTMLPTTTTTTTTTTTPSTTPQQSSDAASQTVTNPNAASPITSVNLQQNLLNAQAQNPFGSTFNDLAFLNSLLQDNTRSSTQKTLTQIEQLLANKILSLAINNPGPTRSPKAINPENASPNSIFHSSTRSPFEPIVIDLNPSSTVTAPTWKPAETPKTTTPKSTISTAERVTWKPVTTAKKDIEFSTGTTVRSTTKIPATVKPKPATTPRPRTTTQAPLGLGSLLWQALLGGNIFGPSTTAKPVKTKPVKTAPKSVNITPKPIPATQKPDTATILRDVDVSKIRVSTANSILIGDKSGTTPASISSTKQPLLNNPNPRLPNVATSTFSPEEDTKFLLELLRAVEKDNKGGGVSKKVPGLTQDDESFLRAILSGRALTTTTTTTTQAPTSDIDNVALLAALLKARGIEPKTPASNLREQLLLASLGQSVTSAPTAFLATESTTIATRPASAATRPTDTKQTVTPSPTSGPRTRTTTWSPSSTYPPSFLSSFSNYGTPVLSAAGDNSGNNALFGVTRAFGQFLGTALSGAAQQLQSFVRNGSRIVSEAVG